MILNSRLYKCLFYLSAFPHHVVDLVTKTQYLFGAHSAGFWLGVSVWRCLLLFHPLVQPLSLSGITNTVD